MSRFNGVAYAGRGRVALTHDTFQGTCEAEVCARFVAWMRSEEGHGWWAACEIDKLIAHYCEENGLTPPPKARARQLILDVPGVYKQRHHLNGPAFDRIAKATGQARAMLYWIPPSETITGPWENCTTDQSVTVADLFATADDRDEPAADQPATVSDQPATVSDRSDDKRNVLCSLCEASIR